MLAARVEVLTAPDGVLAAALGDTAIAAATFAPQACAFDHKCKLSIALRSVKAYPVDGGTRTFPTLLDRRATSVAQVDCTHP